MKSKFQYHDYVTMSAYYNSHNYNLEIEHNFIKKICSFFHASSFLTRRQAVSTFPSHFLIPKK